MDEGEADVQTKAGAFHQPPYSSKSTHGTADRETVTGGIGLIKTGIPAWQTELPVQPFDCQFKAVFRREGAESTSAREMEAVVFRLTIYTSRPNTSFARLMVAAMRPSITHYAFYGVSHYAAYISGCSQSPLSVSCCQILREHLTATRSGRLRAGRDFFFPSTQPGRLTDGVIGD